MKEAGQRAEPPNSGAETTGPQSVATSPEKQSGAEGRVQ